MLEAMIKDINAALKPYGLQVTRIPSEPATASPDAGSDGTGTQQAVVGETPRQRLARLMKQKSVNG